MTLDEIDARLQAMKRTRIFEGPVAREMYDEVEAALRELKAALAKIAELEHYIASREGGKRLTPGTESGKVES